MKRCDFNWTVATSQLFLVADNSRASPTRVTVSILSKAEAMWLLMIYSDWNCVKVNDYLLIDFELCILNSHRIRPQGRYTRKSLGLESRVTLLFCYKFYNEHLCDYTMNTFMTNSVTKNLVTLFVAFFRPIPLFLFFSIRRWTSKQKWTHVPKKSSSKKITAFVRGLELKQSRFPDTSENRPRNLLTPSKWLRHHAKRSKQKWFRCEHVTRISSFIY